MNHLLTSTQYNKIEIEEIFKRAQEMEEHVKEGTNIAQGKILATVFLEPSTRTRLSHETAMLKLGGKVITVADINHTSLMKGETIQDTARVISSYADIIVTRTPEKGMSEAFSEGSSVPVINAGDGQGDHPTQTLLDLYTVWKERGNLDELTIGIMGDCKNSRVLRGMAKMISEFENVKIIFIAPSELKPDTDIEDLLDNRHIEYYGVASLDEVIPELDVLQVNRVRHEYFENKKRAEEIQGQFVISKKIVQKGKDSLILLDPLPRVNTILKEVDELPQAKYFQAVKNSVPVRMALICKMLNL